jgi:hypothetical protein
VRDEIMVGENHVATIENFVDKFLPVKILSQISELLGTVFGTGTPER